jgi:hypothetical protein
MTMKKATLLVLALCGLTAAQGLTIAILGTRSFTDLQDYLDNDPRIDFVTFIGIGWDIPPEEHLKGYDCLITDGWGAVYDQEDYGNILANVVDDGGRVLSVSFSMMGPYGPNDCSPTGRWWDEGYCPYECVSFDRIHTYKNLIIDEPGHPIFDGVDNVNGVFGRVRTELRAGAVELAHFTDAGGVALNADETVCGINYRSTDDHDWTGDGFRLIANAACYLADYVDIQPSSWGRIKALGE